MEAKLGSQLFRRLDGRLKPTALAAAIARDAARIEACLSRIERR